MGDKNILRGPKQNIVKGSFGQTIYQSLKNGGNKIAMVDAETGNSLTYNQMLVQSISLAQHLKMFGLTKNDTICITSANSLSFTIPAISALYLGLTIAPLNHQYSPREFIHALNISKPKVIFSSSNVLETLLKAVIEVPSVLKIIVINDCNKLPVHVRQLADYLRLPLPRDFAVTPVPLDHVFAVMCSSGTTGKPKGVMLTHGNIHAAHQYLKHPDYVEFNSTKVGMALLPFYHAYGFISGLGMLAQHMKVVVLPRFEEKLFLNSIQQYKITMACLVPPLILFLAKSPLVDNYDLSSLTDIPCGAAPLGKEVQDLVIKRLGLKNIRQGYGLTEMALAVTMTPTYNNKSGTVGVLVPSVEGKVINIKTNEILGPHQSGELCFRGALTMKGYCGDVGATAATIDKEGWLHTGDVGYYDEDGFLFIVDRYKELIKYKSYQVPPAEIEDLLLQHPEIKDCGVIGVPDEEAGELPLAFVVKQPNSSINANDVIKFVADNISYHKRLHGGVKFVKDIPKSPTGKILRRVLREQIKTMYSKL